MYEEKRYILHQIKYSPKKTPTVNVFKIAATITSGTNVNIRIGMKRVTTTKKNVVSCECGKGKGT